MSGFPTLVARELRRARMQGGLALPIAFFLLVAILFPFALRPDRSLLSTHVLPSPPPCPSAALESAPSVGAPVRSGLAPSAPTGASRGRPVGRATMLYNADTVTQ